MSALHTQLLIQQASTIITRIQTLAWEEIHHELSASGCAIIPGLLELEECQRLIALYANESLFRKRIVMERHGYGRGEYQYFAYPLPDMITALRASLYSHLVPIANHWNTLMKSPVQYPAQHSDFIARCHAAGQARPTPLLLKYREDDFNCLHQDLYGEHQFPLQVAILLSQPEEDFTGGEFILTEQRPRMQSRPEVVPLRRGDAVIFAVNQRPVNGLRGIYRVNMRHGVSRLRSGNRHTLGIIFHDAE